MTSIYYFKFTKWFEPYSIEDIKQKQLSYNRIFYPCIIVPHAAYRYTFHTMNEIYSRVNFDNISNIFILCTMHALEEKLYLPTFDRIENGLIINKHIIQELSKSNLFEFSLQKYETEHSFELQLPFIKAHLNKYNTQIIPIIVGNGNLYEVSKLLKKYVRQDNLFIISTDFSHTTIVSIKDDMRILAIDKKSYQMLDDNIMNINSDFTICGIFALKLWTLINTTTTHYYPQLLIYESSCDTFINKSDTTGENYCVSYFGIAYQNQKLLTSIFLWRALYLLIKFNIEHRIKIDVSDIPIKFLPRIVLIMASFIQTTDLDLLYSSINNMIEGDYKLQKGVFISLYDLNKLIGCIGTFYEDAIKSNRTLLQNIILYTINTVFLDNRFGDHILRNYQNYYYLYSTDRIHTSINLLNESREIKPDNFWEEYVPCLHGITLHYNSRSATFLPNVMKEQGWISNCQKVVYHKEEFEKNVFGALFNKMGLPFVHYYNWKQGRVFLYEGYEESD